MRKQYIILMGDVVGSREHEGQALADHLLAITDSANKSFGDALESPLTVTLGDEFQGVVKSPEAGVDIILWLEHRLRKEPLKEGDTVRAYQLRYVLHEGAIDTPVNPDRAHGMMGEGLTTARELLTERHRDLPRFRMALADSRRSRRLGDLFSVLATLAEDWKVEDFELIEAMLAENDSEALGKRFNRHRTSIDRRRQTLKIEAYLTLERLLRDIAS